MGGGRHKNVKRPSGASWSWRTREDFWATTARHRRVWQRDDATENDDDGQPRRDATARRRAAAARRAACDAPVVERAHVRVVDVRREVLLPEPLLEVVHVARVRELDEHVRVQRRLGLAVRVAAALVEGAAVTRARGGGRGPSLALRVV